MMLVTDVRVFVPLGLGSGSKWLYGVSRRREDRTDLTLVLLGGVSQAECETDLLGKAATTLGGRVSAGPEAKRLEWLGCISDGPAAQRPRSPVWSEWRRLGQDLLLDRIFLDEDVELSCPVKVFYYLPARCGVQHYGVASANNDSTTSFEFAVEAVHWGAAVHCCLCASLGESQRSGGLFEWLTFLCVSGPVCDSRTTFFETGRLFQTWRQIIALGRKTDRLREEGVAAVNVHVRQARHRQLSKLLQLVVGWIAAYLCVAYRDEILQLLEVGVAWLSDFVRGQSSWLSGTPAGLKLHKPLAEFYAFCLREGAEWMHFYHQTVLRGLICFWRFGWIATAIFGFAVQLALCSDLIYIFQLPITVLYSGLSLLTFAHVKCMVLAWRLLRGQFAREKRKQQRRRPVDGNALHAHFGHDKKAKDDEVLMEHLIVGVLLFTPLLALMPTTLVFFFFLTCLQFAAVFVCSLLAICSTLAVCNPVSRLVIRCLYPTLFPGGLSVSVLTEGTAKCLYEDGRSSELPCQYYTMNAVPSPLASSLRSPLWHCLLLRLWESRVGILFGLQP